ncbi:MAG: hypothetical protein ISS15_15925 [Alphaproteobacteria bacterium]|nr:hypothetical protein [Alphaproteobacteria bacterium]MBL7099148.1 hypothetical protein [Alphaproteobacteria bacterium]
MLAGATALTTTAADARVTVGFSFGGPGYYYGPGYYGPAYYGGYYGNVCDPYSRWYDPYRCDAYGDDYSDYYNGPVFIDGIWLNGGYRSRWYGGHRQFYYNNSWRGGSGWNHGGFSHGGGHWDGGDHHWDGGDHHWDRGDHHWDGGDHWDGGGHWGGHHH